MKAFMKLAGAVMVLMSFVVGCRELMSHRITARDLGANWDVIGSLGCPLGSVVRVGAVVVDGVSTRRKADDGRYLLDIVEVDGKRVDGPTRVAFSDPSKQLPADVFERYVQVTGEPAKTLTPSIIGQINKEYVGCRYDLLVYETGRFTGPRLSMVPVELQQQGEGYSFETYIVILQVKSGNVAPFPQSTDERTR
jgi:hypothetical protein